MSSHEQAGASRSNQEQSGASRSSHEQSGAIGSNQEQSGAIRSTLSTRLRKASSMALFSPSPRPAWCGATPSGTVRRYTASMSREALELSSRSSSCSRLSCGGRAAWRGGAEVRSHHKREEVIGSHRKRSEAIGSHRKRSEAGRNHRKQSPTWRSARAAGGSAASGML